MRGPRDLNVFTLEAHEALGAALLAADRDEGVRVILLSGTARSFSAGADIEAFPRPPADPAGWVRTFLQANSLPERLTKPVLAVVHGAAVAGGFELALACDWILAGPDATFALPEARFGLVAGYGAARLAQSIGAHRARRLLLTGETLNAGDAAALGLHVTAVQQGDPLDAAHEMAEQICRSAPEAVRVIKQRSVSQALALDPGFEVSLEAYTRLWNHPDTQEGIAAFREGRDPVFLPGARDMGSSAPSTQTSERTGSR